MPKARKTDPITSKQAAESVRNITETQRAIYKALRIAQTDQELVKSYRKMKDAPRASESGIRSRRAELVALGYVKDTGARVKLPSGRNAIVWKKA